MEKLSLHKKSDEIIPKLKALIESTSIVFSQLTGYALISSTWIILIALGSKSNLEWYELISLWFLKIMAFICILLAIGQISITYKSMLLSTDKITKSFGYLGFVIY